MDTMKYCRPVRRQLLSCAALFALYVVDVSSARILYKNEGETCRKEGIDSDYVCVHAKHCRPPSSSSSSVDGRGIENRSSAHLNDLDICSFVGIEAIVCCPATLNDKLAESEAADSDSIPADESAQYTEIADRKPRPMAADGMDSSRPVVSPRNEFPHMVLLGYGLTADEEKWGCAGTLVSEKWILTAAHCLRALGPLKASWARLGIAANARDKTGEDRRIAEHVVHPGYEPPSRYDDIALFGLEVDVTFSVNVKPICLNADRLLNPETQIATGWGRTWTAGPLADDLLRVDLNIVPAAAARCNRTCFSKNDGKQLSLLEFGITPGGGVTCACSRHGKDTSRLGDTGGPLQTKNVGASGSPTGLYTQFGVLSFATVCGDEDDTSGVVYTRVSKYVSWIENIVWPV